MKASIKELLSVEKSLYSHNTTSSLKTSQARQHKGNAVKTIFVLSSEFSGNNFLQSLLQEQLKIQVAAEY